MDILFSQSFSQPSTLYVGYLPVYANDAIKHGGFSKSGDEDTEFLMIINEVDLEKPK